jgi:hypothetical protein
VTCSLAECFLGIAWFLGLVVFGTHFVLPFNASQSCQLDDRIFCHCLEKGPIVKQLSAPPWAVPAAGLCVVTSFYALPYIMTFILRMFSESLVRIGESAFLLHDVMMCSDVIMHLSFPRWLPLLLHIVLHTALRSSFL